MSEYENGHLDAFEYIDRSGSYKDFYDVVRKKGNGEIIVERKYGIYLPSSQGPYLLSTDGSEQFSLDQLTPEAQAEAIRIAAGLTAGDKYHWGVTCTDFSWAHDPQNKKATLKETVS